jgi:two-component system, NarL family, nitrate/nitrite response regulator NarL
VAHSRLTTVAIVDDHPLTRKGVKATLEENGSFVVVAEGASGADAIDIARKFKPDLMLLDINMPGGGVEAAQQIGQIHSDIVLMMLTVYDNLSNVKASMRSGVSGYVLKGVDGDEMIAIILKLMRGNKHVSPELAARILAEPEIIETQPAMGSQLTVRDQKILELIAEGLSNREIADHMHLTESTVKQYASQLFKALGVKNRVEAAAKLYRKSR